MQRYICKICKHSFTRQWSLNRHLQDIHKILQLHVTDKPYPGNNRSIDNITCHVNDKGNFKKNFYEDNGKEPRNYSFEPPPSDSDYPLNNYNNPYSDSYPQFNNPYSDSYPQFIPEEQEPFGPSERRRMRRLIPVVIYLLSKKIPVFYAHQFVWLLYDRCVDEESETPFKEYLEKNGMGFLWIYKS
jgi:hypothetical protein